MPHFKKALLESNNSREVHFHIEGNPGFSSVPFFYVSSLENHPPSLHIWSDLSESKGQKRRSAHGLQARNLLGKGVAEDCGVRAAENVPL